jgi:5-(carboxyamino)imidazole ribonucleotide mutase
VSAAKVGIIMGSDSDYETLSAAAEMLTKLGIAYEIAVVSAHRTPERMVEYAKGAEARGLDVIIAGAGGAAHLPGMVASLTQLPVLGVPVQSKALSGLDSLLSIVQMPGGIPTATFAIGRSGRDERCHLRRADPGAHRRVKSRARRSMRCAQRTRRRRSTATRG